jgi:hypothetical protein
MLQTGQYFMRVLPLSTVQFSTRASRFPPLFRKGAREMTLTDLLADPMTLAVMAADRVDPAALKAALSGLARRLERARPAERRRHCLGRDDRPW